MNYEQRLKQVRQLEEEIVELMAMDSNARKPIRERIIARLEAILASLKPRKTK